MAKIVVKSERCKSCGYCIKKNESWDVRGPFYF